MRKETWTRVERVHRFDGESGAGAAVARSEPRSGPTVQVVGGAPSGALVLLAERFLPAQVLDHVGVAALGTGRHQVVRRVHHAAEAALLVQAADAPGPGAAG